MGRGSSRPLQGAALPVVAAAVCWHIGCVFALDDAEGWLLAHNTRRQYFHSKFGKEFKPLLWSGTLADSSKEYADYLVGQNCKFQHCIDTQGRSRCRFGENLGMNWGSRTPRTAEEVLTSWTEEEEDEFGGHFTQVLWRATTYVGCATASAPCGHISVCRYLKPGNCNGRENYLENDTPCGPECPTEGCYNAGSPEAQGVVVSPGSNENASWNGCSSGDSSSACLDPLDESVSDSSVSAPNLAAGKLEKQPPTPVSAPPQSDSSDSKSISTTQGPIPSESLNSTAVPTAAPTLRPATPRTTNQVSDSSEGQEPSPPPSLPQTLSPATPSQTTPPITSPAAPPRDLPAAAPTLPPSTTSPQTAAPTPSRTTAPLLSEDSSEGSFAPALSMSTPVPQDISNFPPPDPIIDWPAERWAEFGGAQLFEAGSPFDLEYTTLRFSGSSYSYCKTKGVRDFPYDPVGGIELHLGDDSVIGIDFSNAFEFPFFGTNHTVAAVSSNGFLSFLRGDYDHSPTILDHYRLPRISALFADLYPGPGTGASISWKQFGMEAVAVTYRDVPAYKQPRLLSSFQIAMHSSGEVMLTWLGIQTTKARLAGLSSGRLPPELGSADLVSDLHPGRCSGTFGLSVLLCPEEQELRLGVVDGQLTAVCYRLDGGETGKLPCDFTSFKIRNNGGDIWAECETAAP